MLTQRPSKIQLTVCSTFLQHLPPLILVTFLNQQLDVLTIILHIVYVHYVDA